MSEVHVSGDVAVRTSAPPAAPTVDVELPPPPPTDPDKAPEFPVASWPEDPGEREDLAIRQSVRELNKQRAERGDRWVTDGGFDQQAPVAKWDASSLPEPGEHESAFRQARRASDALKQARMAVKTAAFETLPSMTPQESRDAAEIFDKMPAVKIPTVSDRGEPVPLLDDRQPVDASLDGFKNLAEAARAMKNYRAFEQQRAQNLMAELQARDDAQNAELQKALAAPTAPEPAPQSQPQLDAAVAQERARLADQARRMELHTQFQRLSAEGQAAANERAQIYQWAQQSYTPGELSGQQPVQGDERAAWLAEASNRFNELESIVRNANTVAAAQQQHIAAARQAQIDRWGDSQDDIFNRQLAERHPQLAADRSKMQKAAKSYLRQTTGLTDAQIAQQWRAGRWRSAPEQMILADAVAHQIGRDSLKSLPSKRVHAPPPVAPGVYRPAGADAEADIGRLQRELDNAPTQRAQLAIARKLTQARRAAGLLNQG
jgi:hypothetical protein